MFLFSSFTLRWCCLELTAVAFAALYLLMNYFSPRFSLRVFDFGRTVDPIGDDNFGFDLF